MKNLSGLLITLTLFTASAHAEILEVSPEAEVYRGQGNISPILGKSAEALLRGLVSAQDYKGVYVYGAIRHILEPSFNYSFSSVSVRVHGYLKKCEMPSWDVAMPDLPALKSVLKQDDLSWEGVKNFRGVISRWDQQRAPAKELSKKRELEIKQCAEYIDTDGTCWAELTKLEEGKYKFAMNPENCPLIGKFTDQEVSISIERLSPTEILIE